jgi:hypothetical protein
VIQVAQKLIAVAFVISPFIAAFLRDTLTPPAQIIGVASIVAGILKITAAVSLAVDGRSEEMQLSLLLIYIYTCVRVCVCACVRVCVCACV